MASGEAEAILLKANATAAGIAAVAKSIKQGEESAQGALSLSVAEKYVEAFGNLAKKGTAVVVPGNLGDISSMIASAMSVYGNVSVAQANNMAKKLVPGEGASEIEDVPETPNEEMKRSMLSSFENTRQKSG